MPGGSALFAQLLHLKRAFLCKGNSVGRGPTSCESKLDAGGFDLLSASGTRRTCVAALSSDTAALCPQGMSRSLWRPSPSAWESTRAMCALSSTTVFPRALTTTTKRQAEQASSSIPIIYAGFYWTPELSMRNAVCPRTIHTSVQLEISRVLRHTKSPAVQDDLIATLVHVTCRHLWLRMEPMLKAGTEARPSVCSTTASPTP